jgi:hypothetical protein
MALRSGHSGLVNKSSSGIDMRRRIPPWRTIIVKQLKMMREIFVENVELRRQGYAAAVKGLERFDKRRNIIRKELTK